MSRPNTGKTDKQRMIGAMLVEHGISLDDWLLCPGFYTVEESTIEGHEVDVQTERKAAS